jgi:hypothetical protein
LNRRRTRRSRLSGRRAGPSGRDNRLREQCGSALRPAGFKKAATQRGQSPFE